MLSTQEQQKHTVESLWVGDKVLQENTRTGQYYKLTLSELGG